MSRELNGKEDQVRRETGKGDPATPAPAIIGGTWYYFSEIGWNFGIRFSQRKERETG
jgi:hypothetical protein